MTKATKQVSTKTTARKPGKGKPTKKQAAKALDASTASVKRSPEPSRRELAAIRAKVHAEYAANKAGADDLMWDDFNKPKPEQPAITTMAELVRALGGLGAVKGWLYIGESDVGGWAHKGHVTPGSQLPVYLALAALGYTRICPKLFGYGSWEEIRLPHMRLPALTV